jgi:hypothetical protein
MNENEQSMEAVTTAAKPKLKSVSELFKTAWKQYSTHFDVLVPIMLLAGIGMYLQWLFLVLEMNGKVVHTTYGLLSLLAVIVYLVGLVWGLSALLNKIHKLDQPMTVKQAFVSAKPLVWPLFLTGLLSGIATLVGFILLVIPGIIVGVWFAFGLYIVVNEHKSGVEALKSSKEYVDGYWWPVFGRSLLVALVFGIITSIIGNIARALFGYDFGLLIQDVISLIFIPLIMLYQYSLYLNIKQVKSGGEMPMSAPVPSEAM